MPSTFHVDSSKKKEKDNKKNPYKSKKKSYTDVKKKTGTNTEINKYTLKKSHTFNSKSKNIFIPDKTIKIEDANYENILKKSKSLVFEKANTFKKFKAVLETIHEESDSKIGSSELSDFKDEIHKDDKDDNINDNNGWDSNNKKIINVDQMNKGNVSHLKNYKLCLENYFTLKMSLFFVL